MSPAIKMMRKHFCFLACIISLCLFAACQKEEEVPLENPDLVGVWYREGAVTLDSIIFTSRGEYHFYADSTFEFIQKIIDPASRTLLGYRYKTTGKYQVWGNRLDLWEVKSYSVNGGTYTGKGQTLYARLEELKLDTEWQMNGWDKYPVPIRMNAQKDVVQIGARPCPINASCLPGPQYSSYTKEKKPPFIK
jgi:hypothetical protein